MGLPCSKVDIAIDDAVALEVAFKTNDLTTAGIRVINLVEQRRRLNAAGRARVDDYAKRFINASLPPQEDHEKDEKVNEDLKVPDLVRQ